jgi:diacylglycerol kinase family enzyme
VQPIGQYLPRRLRQPLSKPLSAPPVPRRIVAIINPVSRQAQRVEDELAVRAAALGLPQPTILKTTIEDPGAGQGAQAIREGADLVIVAGGDGTVRNVFGALTEQPVTTAVIPIGSGNILARNLGVPRRDIGAAVTLALTGKAGTIDLCWVQTETDTGWSAKQPMLAMAGIGHDAASVQQVRPGLKQRWGWVAYAEAGIHSALAKPLPMNVSIDGASPTEIAAWSILAANCALVPGNTVVFPGAALDSGELSLMRVSVDNPAKWIPIAAKGLTNFEADVPGLSYRTGRELLVETASPTPVQVDGDVIDAVRAMRVTITPAALAVRVSSDASSA